MDSTPDPKEETMNHVLIRFIIVIIVAIAIVGAIVITNGDNNMSKDKGEFEFARASVEQKNGSLVITGWGNSSIYNVSIIAKNDNSEVIKRDKFISTENCTVDIADLIDADMDIWVEVENTSYSITEKKQWRVRDGN